MMKIIEIIFQTFCFKACYKIITWNTEYIKWSYVLLKFFLYFTGSNIWKIHWITPKFIPGTDRCPYVCHCFGKFINHHDPPLLYDLANDISESHPIDVASNKKYLEIIAYINNKRTEHEKSIEKVTDQFSFSNTVWKPWLQPCCNFPLCKCLDPEFKNITV